MTNNDCAFLHIEGQMFFSTEMLSALIIATLTIMKSTQHGLFISFKGNFHNINKVTLIPFKMNLIQLTLFLLMISVSNSSNYISTNNIDYENVYREIKSVTYSNVYQKGSRSYRKRKLTQNGWCSHISPDLIVVPKSTIDVANIVKISRRYNVPLSVRSGGHSYICANIKNEGIQIDTRGLNKIELTSRYPFLPKGPALLLGPGQTWGRVLKFIPPDRYTLIHGACTSVGVGGYLIGGGAQASGTTQRFGFGNFNVLQFTMVDANGNIIKASDTYNSFHF